jgi:hypothetical protein
MFRSTLRIVPLALAIAAVSACGVKKTTTAINPSYSRAATCDEAIVVYDSRGKVPYDYYEVAWVEAEGSSVYTTDNKIRSEVIKAAAKAGANAIIINPAQEANATAKVLGEALGMNSSTTKISALAIYMPHDAPRVTQVCGPR